jgi:imidazolonepropionase-like amidohydrolase
LVVRGASYQEIAEKGGIPHSVRHVRAASRGAKTATAAHLWTVMKQGTATVEIKTDTAWIWIPKSNA